MCFEDSTWSSDIGMQEPAACMHAETFAWQLLLGGALQRMVIGLATEAATGAGMQKGV